MSGTSMPSPPAKAAATVPASVPASASPASASPATAPPTAAPSGDANISPGSDVSPMTHAPDQIASGAGSTTPKPNAGYFTPQATAAASSSTATTQALSTPGTSIASGSVEGPRSDTRTEGSEETALSSAASVAVSSPALTAEGTPVQDRRPSSVLDLGSEVGNGQASRKPSSAASVTFRPPRNPSLPQGHPKQARIQSPAPNR
ncbi:hypothetical protein SBRCBS47491_002894 [Sporothrix bragantina]|uniref:Uncharacterized protein n=1 Tax=Sporothrix bragantina TaxID=671064 RepID=A0ABP0BBQ9_9PEZI